MKKITLILFTLICCFTLNAQTVSIGETSYNTITEAIAVANDGDIISITGIHTEAISLDKSITLMGADPTTDIIQESTTAGSDGSGTGVVNIVRAEDTDVLNITIENLGIRNGNTANNGGGINVDKVTGLITLKNLIIENNHSAKNGGALGLAGSKVDIIECTIKNNSSTLDGGAVLAAPNNAAAVNSVINFKQSVIDSNSGRNGGGIYINGNPGFGDNFKIAVNIENSTISNNQATSPSGGNGGGSVWSRSATYQGTGGGANVDLQLVHATFYNNTHAAAGKQGMRFGGTSETNFSAYNSIIVNANVASDRAINFAGVNVTNITNCILGGLENAASFLSIIDDANKNNLKGRTAVQAGITGSLTDEGGKTQVLAIADASNAVDFCTATTTGLTLPTIDQRGAARNGTADAGAFEFGGVLKTNNYDFGRLVSIYPNPAKNIVNIKGVENVESIQIFTILGKIAKEVKSQNSINISSLSKGIYLISIQKENNFVSKRLLIE
tara:strand:- start:4562 stop:6061 length:1500 start_codon:yes stop_codon:yes gene_type:complete